MKRTKKRFIWLLILYYVCVNLTNDNLNSIQPIMLANLMSATPTDRQYVHAKQNLYATCNPFGTSRLESINIYNVTWTRDVRKLLWAHALLYWFFAHNNLPPGVYHWIKTVRKLKKKNSSHQEECYGTMIFSPSRVEWRQYINKVKLTNYNHALR
jgi:hypothetical protein